MIFSKLKLKEVEKITRKNFLRFNIFFFGKPNKENRSTELNFILEIFSIIGEYLRTDKRSFRLVPTQEAYRGKEIFSIFKRGLDYEK